MVGVSTIDPKRLIDQGLPASVRSQLALAIYRGYALVEALRNDVALLKWEVGYDLLGYLRRVAVEFEIKRLIDNGNVPQTYRYRIGWNAAQNCRHIEVFNERCVVTVSQVQQPGAIPRLAVFRTNLGIGNYQLAFDFENGRVNDGRYAEAKKIPYFLLTHGYGKAVPDFAFLGIPAPDVRSWIFKLDLLSESRHIRLVPEERVESNDIVSLKQYVQETLMERK